MLELNDVDIGYPSQRLLKGVSLFLQSGHSLCIETAVLDGASTTLKCIAGMQPTMAGTVHINGDNIHSLEDSERIKRVVYCFEHGGLVSTFSVLNNVVFPLRYHGLMSESEAISTVFEVAKKLGIDSLLHLEPYQLNDVQTRLTNLLRAMCFKPRVLLLDEIQAGMSDDMITQLIETLRDYQSATQCAIVMTVTAGDRIDFCQRLARIHQGRLEILK